MMKKIDFLLVYPKPSVVTHLKLTPLSILYPGAMFEQQGLKVAYYDDRFDSEDMLTELIKDAKEIGVSVFIGYQSGRAAEILEKAKKINPGIITGVGGHHARLLPRDVSAEPFVDKIWTGIYGEDLIPYNENNKIIFQRTDMMYFTSRGCPHACSFCALRSPWVPKDLDVVERELWIIHNDTGFKDIFLCDPNIAFGSEDEKRVARINRIGKIMRGLGARWSGNLRVPYLTPRMVEALVKSNCASIEIGCESGNDLFLKKIIKKGHGVDAIKEAVKNVKGSGLSIMCSFIANMPRETSDMLKETMDLIDWIKETDPCVKLSVYSYTPYPGSPMYDDAIGGVEGYPKFSPPKTMKGWSELPLMASPIYWIAGLCFRQDNTRKNFRGQDWGLIRPYVELAQKKWKNRDVSDFPCAEVEELIARQVEKNRAIEPQKSTGGLKP